MSKKMTNAKGPAKTVPAPTPQSSPSASTQLDPALVEIANEILSEIRVHLGDIVEEEMRVLLKASQSFAYVMINEVYASNSLLGTSPRGLALKVCDAMRKAARDIKAMSTDGVKVGLNPGHSTVAKPPWANLVSDA